MIVDEVLTVLWLNWVFLVPVVDLKFGSWGQKRSKPVLKLLKLEEFHQYEQPASLPNIFFRDKWRQGFDGLHRYGLACLPRLQIKVPLSFFLNEILWIGFSDIYD